MIKTLYILGLSIFLSLWPVSINEQVTIARQEIKPIETPLPDLEIFVEGFEIITPAVIGTERYCLVQAIYFEARNQSLKGQLAVAYVVLNRKASKKYPNTLCRVVFQPKQFSFTHDGKSDRMFERKPRRVAEIVADIALNNRYDDPTNGATMYHADYADPYWNTYMEQTEKIDNHKFYRGF